MTLPPTGPASAGGPAAEQTMCGQRMHAPTADTCPGPRNWTPACAGTPRAQLTHLPDTEGSHNLTL
jgi:hypothetical protein